MRRNSWPYLGAVLGGIVSVAANLAHSYLPPEGLTAAEWSPEPGAVAAAAFWPLALLIAIEILIRTAWPSGGWWLLLRWAGLLPVAVVAALVSYRHLSDLLTYYGEPRVTAVIGPLAVDGLMIMASSALVAAARAPESTPGNAPGSTPESTPKSTPGNAPGSTPAAASKSGTATRSSRTGSAATTARRRTTNTTGSSGRATDDDLIRRLRHLVSTGQLEPDASVRQLQAALGVGFARAKRIHAAAFHLHAVTDQEPATSTPREEPA